MEALIKNYENEKTVLEYEDIKKMIWNENEIISNERLRTFIRRLREKTSKALLINVKGRGYQIALD